MLFRSLVVPAAGGRVGEDRLPVRPPPLRGEHDRQTRQPNGDKRCRAEGDTAKDSAHPSARRQPNGEDENRELRAEGAEPQQPQPSPVALAPGQLGRCQNLPRLYVR